MKTKPQTLGQLADCFIDWLTAEALAGRTRPATVDYYRRHVGRWAALVGRRQRLVDLVPYDLERHKRGWHDVQAVQRLFNWGVGVGLVAVNPFRSVPRGRLGQRTRTLSRSETARLLRTAHPAFRRYLVALRHTMARPQELRALKWSDLQPDGRSFVLRSFKGQQRRSDGVTVRVIMLDAYMRRWVSRRRRAARPEDHVFLNSQGRPWQGNALVCAMRRTRRRAGLNSGGELVVCYTFRHTAATAATAAGVRDRRLADLLGHSTTRTTARYQHLSAAELGEAIEQATARRRRA